MGGERPTLKDGYYLENFEMLTGFVENRYADLLNDEEIGFLRDFRPLSLAARRLYVRLITRKGPEFRSDRLSYGEIPLTERAAFELSGAGFLRIDGGADDGTGALFNLLTKAEIFEWFPGCDRGLRKEELVAELESAIEPDVVVKVLLTHFHRYRPLRIEIVDIFRLLFFGNLHQDLSEFVITDLGIVTYESYDVDSDSRFFESRGYVDAVVLYHAILDEMSTHPGEQDAVLLGDWAEQVVRSAAESPINQRMALNAGRDRILNTIARQMERIGRPEDALRLYEYAIDPPARERRTRILMALGRYGEAGALVREIAAEPLSEEESEFAVSTVSRRGELLGMISPKESSIRPHIPEEHLMLERHGAVSVEERSLEHYQSQGYNGYFCENALMCGLFALEFWDILFSSVQGAFFNKYQREPADLRTPDFRRRRSTEIQARLEEVRSGTGYRRRILETYRAKRDIACSLVHWQRLPLELVESAVEAIPHVPLSAVFDHLSRDVKANRSGFPDLALFDSCGGYRFVEVKGPGDQIQKNQRRWMKRFVEWEIPVAVVWVEWADQLSR